MFSNMGPYIESNFNSQLVSTENTGMIHMKLVLLYYIVYVQGM